MHKYLRAIGFSKELNRKTLKPLLLDVCRTAEEKNYISIDNDTVLAEYCKEFADRIGICVRAELDDEDNNIYEYYFPYLRGEGVSSYEDLSIDRHIDKESYVGACDELKVGVSLIFYLQNVVKYLKYKNSDITPTSSSLTLAALSTEGTIMFPIEKKQKDVKLVQNKFRERNVLLNRARMGDEEAIESITLDDMDTYSIVQNKIHEEDVYTLVDNYFMPTGMECDQYAILGDILECEKVINSYTNEEVYIMRISANDLEFDVCINSEDLYGEPMAGRRFKGSIWMQGFVNLEE